MKKIKIQKMRGKEKVSQHTQDNVVIWATANLDDQICPYKVDAKQRKRAGSQSLANP